MNTKSSVQLTVTNKTSEEMTQQTYNADHYIKGANHYYRYIENETEMGRTSTLLKVSGNEIRIIRQGDIKSEHAFAASEVRRGFYETAEGTLPISTETSSMSVNLVNGIGYVEWKYRLEIMDSPAGEYHLRVDIASRHLDE